MKYYVLSKFHQDLNVSFFSVSDDFFKATTQL